MSEAEAAWAAGLLEGEGWFGVARAPSSSARASLRASVEMRDQDVVERIAGLFPGAWQVKRRDRTGYVQGSIHIRDTHHVTFVTGWSGANAERVMRAVLPHMGERRAAKIRECLDTPNLSHYPKRMELHA